MLSLKRYTRLDLNLLVCLYVLLEECNVTHTARRLHLSQSAVSKNLARLREQLNDPLFIRISHGMKPTPRALELLPTLEKLFSEIDDFIVPTSFEPHSSNRHFKMALVDIVYTLFLPKFINDIFTEAPNITLDTQSWWKPNTFEKLKNGELDFGIFAKDIKPKDDLLTLNPPKGILSQELCRDTHQCVVRKNHPILRQDKREWNRDCYLEQRHIQVRCGLDDLWLLDYILAEKCLSRDIAIYVPDFNSAVNLCANTDFVLTAPSYFANEIAAKLDLVVLPLPIEIPSIAYTLFWSQHQEKDLGHRWLRQMIISRWRDFYTTCNKK